MSPVFPPEQYANAQVIAALFLAASAAAAPFAREACAYQCSDVCYFQRTIDAAVAKGYSLHEEGKTIREYIDRRPEVASSSLARTTLKLCQLAPSLRSPRSLRANSRQLPAPVQQP